MDFRLDRELSRDQSMMTREALTSEGFGGGCQVWGNGGRSPPLHLRIGASKQAGGNGGQGPAATDALIGQNRAVIRRALQEPTRSAFIGDLRAADCARREALRQAQRNLARSSGAYAGRLDVQVGEAYD
jgi:hypothetical protein